MVSPLQSIVAGLRPAQDPLMQVGDILARGRRVNSNLQSQELQRQNLQQQMSQRQQEMTSEQSLGAARYLNSLGKQLLSVDESQWPQILGPNLPQLQQLGYTPEILQGMTREQIQGVVAQTEPLMPSQTQKDKDTSNIRDLREYERLVKRDPKLAKMFAKDVGLLPKDKPISSISEKNLIDAQSKFMDSKTKATEYDLLADDFLRFKDSLPTGKAATISEFIKSSTGTQDEETELRRRLQKVRLSQALKNLPPGPATDKDVAEAMKGVPKENASVDQVLQFLRGSAKIESLEADFQEFKANYISDNDGSKGLIKAWKQAIKDGKIDSYNDVVSGGTSSEPAGIRFLGFE